MTNLDPFQRPGDAGETVIRPIPGGRRTPLAPSPSPTPLPPAAPSPDSVASLPSGWPEPAPEAPLLNPLVSCAAGLLTLAGELRRTLAHPDPAGLREGLVRQIRAFETCARAKGLVDAVVLPARYVLCALIDESVLDTPWGARSVWSHQGLLISFHNETWGGEKFFTALDRLLAYPQGNLHLLELMYLCLALGFEGRYRTRPEGQAQLERVREQLYQTIRGQRGDPEADLSLHWRGMALTPHPLFQQLPLWVFAAVAGLLLVGLFAFYSLSLNRHSDPVFLALNQLDQGLDVIVERPRVPVQEPPTSEPTPAPLTPLLTLRLLLAEDIAAGRLEVVPDRDHPRRCPLRLGQQPDPAGLRTPGAAYRRGPSEAAGADPGDWPFRQPAHQDPALPLELAPLPGAGRTGDPCPDRGGRGCLAFHRRGSGRCRAPDSGEPPGPA